MSAPHIILDNLPSLCQKLLDLVAVWRIVITKIILLVFYWDTVYKLTGWWCAEYDAETLSVMHNKAVQHCRAEDCFVGGAEFFAGERSSLIRQSYHNTRNFDRVLLRLPRTYWTLMGNRRSSLKRLNCWKFVHAMCGLIKYSGHDCILISRLNCKV